MAERRMFAKTIIDSDAFIDMPITARLLYYDLGMRADDDGFVNSPKKIMRMVGASQDDLAILITKKFIIPFENGVVVIKHWRIHNYIQKDRYKPTKYVDEKSQLTVKDNGAYTLDTECIQDGYKLDTQARDRLGEDSLGKDRLNTYCAEADEVIDYLNMRTGTKYRHVDSTRKHIQARLKEGFSVQDCKDVIDKKCVEWMNSDMEKYLRPQTLFNSEKFQNYLNAPVKQRKGQNVF